jgi:hypothetical protein
MPPTSEHLPLLGIYYAVTIGIVSFSTAMAVVTLHINNKGSRGKKVPRIIKTIFLKYMAKIVRTDLTNARLMYLKKKYNIETLEKLPLMESEDQMSYMSRKNSYKRKFSSNSEDECAKQIKIDIKNENSDEILLEVIDDNQHEYNRAASSRSREEHSRFIENTSELAGEKLVLRSTPARKNEKLNISTSSLYQKCHKNEQQTTLKIKSLEEDQSKQIKPSKELLTTTLPIKRPIQNFSVNQSGHSPNFCGSCKRMRRKSSDHANKLEFLYELDRLLQRQFSPLVHHVIKQVNNSEKRLEERERLEIIEREWSDVAMVFDHILCYLFCFITLTSTLLIFTNSPHVLSNW